MEYKCPKCKTVVTAEKRAHVCKGTRCIHGKLVNSIVIYQPNLPKPNKQSTQPGYVKRFTPEWQGWDYGGGVDDPRY